MVGKRVLVTGATGFVGRALTARLVAAGASVWGTLLGWESPDSVSAGVEPVVIEPLDGDTPWSHALAGVEVVIHLAARVHIMAESAGDPLSEFRKVNTAGTRRLAREAAAAGVKRLVFVSSVKVNGEESSVPYSEASPENPTDPYGISKWEAEQALRQIEAETGLEVVVLRPTLVYGPGVRANFLSMLKAVHRGTPLPLGSIANRRSLVYLGNLVDAVVACARESRAAGRTFLVSDGEDVSTPELLRLAASALGAKPRVLPFPVPLMRLAAKLTGESARVSRLTGSLAVDSSRIRAELGWRPPYTLRAGLKSTADWYLASHGGT